MRKLWKRLLQFFHRENSVISRQAQLEQQRSMMIGVRTAEEDMLMRLAELDKALSRER